MNPQHPEQPDEAPARPEPAVSTARRRLLRAAPALTVLPAAPVLAANCKLPSGFSVSGNLSRSGGTGCGDPAPLPSRWASLTYGTGRIPTYTGTPIRTNHPFNLLFPGGTTDTMATVLAYGNSNEYALFASVRLQAIAARGSPGFPSEPEVLRMWNESRVGLYSPTPGVTWTIDQVIKFLRYLTGQTLA